MNNEAQAAAAETVTESAPVEAGVLRDMDDKIAKSMETAYDLAQHTPKGQPSKSPRRLPDESSFPRAATASGKTEQPEAPKETAVNNDIKPPPSWDAKARAKWGAIDPELRDYIVKRETEAHARLSEFGRSAKQLGELSGIFEQFRESIPRTPDGQTMPPQSVIQHLLTANHILETNPRAAIEWLARSKGIDLEFDQQHAPQQIDLEQVRQEARQEMLQYMQQQQRVAEEQQAESYIKQFAADKEHWSAVESQVLYHILALKGTNPEMGYQKILHTAYDRALADRPELDPKAKEKAQSELQERKRRAAEAKRLASINVSSRSTGKSVPVRKDMYSEMADVYDRITGG